MLNISLYEIENHFDELEKRLIALQKEEAEVGYFLEQGVHEDSKMSYVNLIGLLSAGYSKNNLPARPVFQYATQTFKFKDTRLKKDLKDYFSDIKKTKRSNAADKVVKNWVRDFSQEVVDTFGHTPPLAENALSVQKVKGTNSPLVDTGDLRDNLAYKINKDGYKLTKNLGK